MWESKNKNDLIIEVWEKLDCESVGAVEIEAIETVVFDVFGKAAVGSPMTIARLLADEGAELRHSEIMDLYVRRASDRPYDAVLRNILNTSDLKSALRSIRQMENLRRKFASEKDREGLRLLRDRVLKEKEAKLALAGKAKSAAGTRAEAREISEWLTLWLQSPEIFENWIALRSRSEDFVSKFGEI
ncbi:MAG TPA: hypothetical protein VFZ23_18440 [Pyrinomonadaceae bacterium]